MSMNQEDVSEWIKSYVARLLGVDSDGIDVDTPFERYGLDSTAAVGLSGDLGELLGLRLDTNIVFHFPTVSSLAEHVSAALQRDRGVVAETWP